MKKTVFVIIMFALNFNTWAQYNTVNSVTKICKIMPEYNSKDPGTIEISLTRTGLTVSVLTRSIYFQTLNFNGVFKAVLNNRNENVIENGNLVFSGYIGGNAPNKILASSSLLSSTPYGLVYFSFAKGVYSSTAVSVPFSCN